MRILNIATDPGSVDYLEWSLYRDDEPMEDPIDDPAQRVGRHLLAHMNDTGDYSPITLNSAWSTLWRLIFVFFFTTIGTIVNGFFVAAFFIEHPLKKKGNVYLACVGLSDMIITTGVMPASIVVLLSGQWDTPPVCQALQFLAQASIYAYSLLFMMVALENHYRLCGFPESYKKFLSVPVSFLSILAFLVGCVTSAVGVYLKLDYDYCTREHYGDYKFRLITAALFQALPFVVTVLLLVSTSLRLRAHASRDIHYRRSLIYDQDYSFINVNIACYVFFVVAWTPYLIVVNGFPGATDATYYNCVWIGLTRSIITSFLYSGLNRYFRRAFSHLFYYCCCKSSMTAPYNNHHSRNANIKVANGDVRVHIMHHTVYNSSFPRHGQLREDHNLEF